MDASAVEGRPGLNAPGPGRFDLGRLACWVPLCGVLGLSVALAAVATHKYVASFELLALMVGVCLGGMLIGLLRVSHVGHRPTVLVGTLLACALAVVGQDYIAYLQAQERVRADWKKHAEIKLGFPDAVPPEGFAAFMKWNASQGRKIGNWEARDHWAWLSWGLDALLVLAPATVLVLSAARLPYCNRCRRWYYTAQGGRIEPAAARQLAEVVDVTVGGQMRRSRYRVIRCPGGCGPAGFSLSWEQRDGDYAAGPIWLGPAERGRIQGILDESAAKRQAETEDQDPTDRGPLNPEP